MDLAIIAAKQVLEMFLMILAGFICLNRNNQGRR